MGETGDAWREVEVGVEVEWGCAAEGGSGGWDWGCGGWQAWETWRKVEVGSGDVGARVDVEVGRGGGAGVEVEGGIGIVRLRLRGEEAWGF